MNCRSNRAGCERTLRVKRSVQLTKFLLLAMVASMFFAQVSHSEFSELKSWGKKDHIFYASTPSVKSDLGGISSSMYFSLEANALSNCEPRLVITHTYDHFGAYSGIYPSGSSKVSVYFVIDGVDKRYVSGATINESKRRDLQNGATRQSHFVRISAQHDLDKVLPYLINAKDVEIWIAPEEYFSRTPSFSWELDGLRDGLISVINGCEVRKKQLSRASSEEEKNPKAIWGAP